MQKKTKRLLIIAVIILVLLAGAYFIYGPKAQAGSKQITVTVDHLSKEDASFEIKTDAEFLREALETEGLVSGTESEYGLWIDTVDGEKADSSKEEWWGYSVNGEFSNYGVDDQPIKDGDKYEFKLNEGY